MSRKLISTDDLCIVRTARQMHRCICADDGPDKQAGCIGDIMPGTQYVEYMGETPAFSSGSRYCGPCAVQAWGKWGVTWG